MANQPIQLPNIDLPGAEFFSLSPNRTVALQGRRRVAFDSGFVAAPPATDNINAIATQVLEPNFLPTSGIYVHHFFANITTNGAGSLTVINVFAGLSLIGGFPEFPLGSPTLTNPQINIATNLISDRERLVTYRDVAIGSGAAVNTNTLSLQAQLNVDNAGDAAAEFKIFGIIIYTRLDGFVE